MQKKVFRKTPLAAGISVAILAGNVMAQDQVVSEGAMEEIVVTGIRASLQRSMDVKRNMDGVVDAISAEDIGDFPDTNLAESLQRITGVSIDRERGEGSTVTVRGFGPEFNLVTLNGRQMPTNNGTSRSFDFGNLASEGISAVEVYKTGRADVPTGGIGSTINIKTTRPLEAPGFKLTGAVSAMQDESVVDGEETTPEVSLLFSNTFADDTVGVALSLVRQERESGAATANVGGWRTFDGAVNNSWGCGWGPEEWGGIPANSDSGDPTCNTWQGVQNNRPEPGDLYSVPQAIGYEVAEYDRTRTNGQATFQFRPSDSVTATLDYTYAEFELERTYNNLSAWFNFDAQDTTWTDGPQASPLIYREFLGGSDYSMGAGLDAFVSDLSSVGLNVVWDVNDNLTMEFDYHDSTSERKPDSPYGDSALLSIASFTRNVTAGYFDKELPVLELELGNPLSANDMVTTGSVFQNNISEMDIEQARVSGSYTFDSGFIESIDFGIELTEVNNQSASSVVQRDAWSSAAPWNTPLGGIADLLTPASMAGVFDEIPGGNDPRLQTDFFTWNMADVINRMTDLTNNGTLALFPIADQGDCGTGLCKSSTLSTDRLTTEESEAIYIQANAATEWGAMPVAMRFGLRYESTDVDSEALAPSYVGLNWVAGNELSAIRGAEVYTELSGDYSVVLPNFDFRIDFTENLVGRFSAGKSLTRPNYEDIQGGQTIDQLVRVSGGTGRRGNPDLEPFESTNLDLSLEWYYGDDSYFAVGYFEKDVENFIGTSSVVEETFGLPHPANGPLGDEARAATGSIDGGALYSWILANRPDAEGVDAANGVIAGVAGRDDAVAFNLTVPVNIEEATMDGFEVVLQHTFGDSGFGFILNGTIVDADVGYDNFSLEQQFVLTGLSDSANAILFYDKNGINLRLAYNWRDDFLAGTGQANVGSGPPTYVAEYEQWDLSASYWFNDNLQVYFDALNITDETRHVYGRDKLQTLFAAQFGPRYNLGVRYKF